MKRLFGLCLMLALLLGGCAPTPAVPGDADASEPPTDAPAAGAPTATPGIAFDATVAPGALTADGLAARVASADAAWLFAVNVGKGDALILRAGGFTALIDAGRARACGRVCAALRALGVERLDAAFLTHTDADHAEGFEWLAASDIPVGAWYASAMYTGVKAEKHPAARAAAARGQSVIWLKRGDAVPLGDSGATLTVLAPNSYYADSDDDNSLVMLLACAQGRMLLTGDMELPEEAELLSLGDDLSCDVLKVPNHGDGDATGEALACACAARVAVISTDGAEKPGTPDPGVVARLEAAGSAVAVTEDAGLGILATLAGGDSAAERVDFGRPWVEGLAIAGVDAADDRVILANRSGAAIGLAGFTLCSGRGGEVFRFPDGARIDAGGTLVVGTRSTDGDFDLLWDEKRVIHKKKADTVALYDDLGRLMDEADNGL